MLTRRFGPFATMMTLLLSLFLIGLAIYIGLFTKPAEYDAAVETGKMIKQSFTIIIGLGGIGFGAMCLYAAGATPKSNWG